MTFYNNTRVENFNSYTTENIGISATFSFNPSQNLEFIKKINESFIQIA